MVSLDSASAVCSQLCDCDESVVVGDESVVVGDESVVVGDESLVVGDESLVGFTE